MNKPAYVSTVSATLLWLIKLLSGIGLIVGIVKGIVPAIAEIKNASGAALDSASDLAQYQALLTEAGLTPDQISELFSTYSKELGIVVTIAAVLLAIPLFLYVLSKIFVLLDAIGATLLRFSGAGAGVIRGVHSLISVFYIFITLDGIILTVALILSRNKLDDPAAGIAAAVVLGIATLFALLDSRYHRGIAKAMEAIEEEVDGVSDGMKKTHLAGISTFFGILTLIGAAVIVLGSVMLIINGDAPITTLIGCAGVIMEAVKYFLVASCYKNMKEYYGV